MTIVNLRSAGVLRTGHGSEIRPLIDRTTSETTRCSLAEELLPPGHAVRAHFHRETEEIYYVLEGVGEMRVGEEVAAVGAGDAVFIPRHTVHTLSNTGEVPMRVLLVCGPAFRHEDEHFVP
jgi:mannose-6-phosphate isomerase-like protein (cupin superfamily)